MKRQQGTAQVVAVVVISMFFLAPPALAQDCPELLRQWAHQPIRAGVLAVAMSGDYAYVAGDRGLSVIDVSTPWAPFEVGFVAAPGPGQASDVAVSGGHAYVAWDNWEFLEGGLWVIDVSGPTAPVGVGFVATPREAVGVAVDDGYAYVTAWGSGLRVIDVSAPSAPVEVGFVDIPSEVAGVAVSGGYAYVAAGGAGLWVIDVSNPTTPVEVASIDTHDDANGVAVSGSYAYVVGAGLSVFDVSVPTAPVEVGFVETPPVAWGVAVSGSYAYVAGASLTVIDVSTPFAPVQVGSVEYLFTWDVAVSGSYAYAVAGLLYPYSLRVIDVSRPSAPMEVGFVDTPGEAAGVAVSDGYAYVTWGDQNTGVGGLFVVNVSTGYWPAEVGFVDTPGPAWDVAVSGSYAYVVWSHWYAGEGGLRVFDVSVPSAPVEVGFVDTGCVLDVAVSGGHAYVTARSPEAVRVIDVSVPSAPVEVGFVEIPGDPRDVAVAGDYAYVVTGGFGPHSLRVIDVSTPSAPVEVGFVDTNHDYPLAVAASGGYAYVGGFSLSVIDVSTPSVPLRVGWLGSPGLLMDVEVSDGHAYVADRDRGLLVIDVRAPSAPVEVGHYGTPDGAAGVSVSDGLVFLAAGGAELYVFRECGPFMDARECFIPAAAVAAGAQGAFFSTDVEINNKGTEEAQVLFQWLPRGDDNSEPLQSEPITLASGQSLRYENILTALFNLGPDSLGALKMVASTSSVIGMSRTYNSPEGWAAGTFGQGLPAIRATDMITGRVPQRIIFLSEDFVSRANVGCVNGSSEPVRINMELFNFEGESLGVETMDLGPYSNDQINHVLQGHLLGNGYVDVWADDLDALYTCYGSVLDNVTSDPTTILPQVPSADMTFIPAAALAAGLEGAFFETDVDLNNVGSTDLTYELLWLPRGSNNSDPVHSDTFSLAPNAGVRYANVLNEVFGLEPDQVGALAVEASGIDLLAMSRTYNLPSAKVAGTFGQGLPGIPADRMIRTGVRKRIIFMNQNDDVRSNVGCQNGSWQAVRVFIELFNSEGESLEVKTMDLAPLSNNQINRVFWDYAPIAAGYVDVWTDTPGATIYCYGSVLDNVTSDPTTIPPM